jgi:hypothetical protein
MRSLSLNPLMKVIPLAGPALMQGPLFYILGEQPNELYPSNHPDIGPRKSTERLPRAYRHEAAQRERAA